MAKGNNDLALCGEINPGKIRQLHKRIDKNSQLIDVIVDKLVQDYCKPLDEYMYHIQNILQDENNPPTNEELDSFTLNLPVLLYFTGEAQETLGVREDVAKAVKMELYNKAYEEASGTIADKTATAELATQSEYIAQIAYSRAYKKIRLRMDLANECLQAVKKVLTRRISEQDLARVDDGRFGGYERGN